MAAVIQSMVEGDVPVGLRRTAEVGDKRGTADLYRIIQQPQQNTPPDGALNCPRISATKPHPWHSIHHQHPDLSDLTSHLSTPEHSNQIYPPNIPYSTPNNPNATHTPKHPRTIPPNPHSPPNTIILRPLRRRNRQPAPRHPSIHLLSHLQR